MSGVSFGDFWVTRFSTLWDAYLLKKFLEYYRAVMSPEIFERLKGKVEAEAREYQAMMGHVTEAQMSLEKM
jgi:hypothetical protein